MCSSGTERIDIVMSFQNRLRCIGCVAAFGMGILMSAPAMAQGDAVVEGYKVGVVNMKAVFDGYDRQTQEMKTLETDVKARQDVLDTQRKKIDSEKEDYVAKKDALSDEAKTKREDEINRLIRDYEAGWKREQEDTDLKTKRLLEAVFADIQEAIKAVGGQGNYHLILELDERTRKGVLYSSPTLDITQKVAQHLNEQYSKKK